MFEQPLFRSLAVLVALLLPVPAAADYVLHEYFEGLDDQRGVPVIPEQHILAQTFKLGTTTLGIYGGYLAAVDLELWRPGTPDPRPVTVGVYTTEWLSFRRIPDQLIAEATIPASDLPTEPGTWTRFETRNHDYYTDHSWYAIVVDSGDLDEVRVQSSEGDGYPNPYGYSMWGPKPGGPDPWLPSWNDDVHFRVWLIPLPATVWMGLTMLGGMGVVGGIRRKLRGS